MWEIRANIRKCAVGGDNINVDLELIEQAKEKLGDENAVIIAKELGLEKFDKHNLKALCCFHSEKTPSFVYNRKIHKFHCFGCSKNADVIDAFMHDGMTYIEAVKKLFSITDTPYSFGEHRVKTKRDYRYPKEVKCENRSKAEAYLSLRKISPQTMDYADVREDNEGNIVFNFYDTNDVLTMVKYRPSRKVNKGENKTWCQKGADTAHILFNMNRINTDAPLIICEGEIDCLSLIECGFYNSVSVPLGAGNTHWVNENWDWLDQFNEIIICADNDEAGMKMQKDVVYRLGSWRTKFVNIPYYIERDGMRVPVKDINEVLYHFGKEKVSELVLGAQDTPVDSVVDFSDITNVDLDDIDGIETGIKDLDRNLMKLFYGTFNIITGVNGSGKSSFLSQLIAQSVEQDKNVFLYSGELPNFQSKNWINYIFAGQRNLDMCRYNDTVFWKVKSEALREINVHYREKIYIYKDDQDHKAASILRSMEENARRYGAKLFIIDNLTSVNLENNDNNKYEKQAEFVNNLIAFAKRFNVTVCLVVHPHKIETMRRLTKMDVQGISAIIDLAHRIISLYRVTEADKKGQPKLKGEGWFKEPVSYDVLCDVLKDRMLGREGATVGLYYDRPSRRFFTSEDDLDMNFSWDKKTYDTPLPYPPPQLKADPEAFGEVA